MDYDLKALPSGEKVFVDSNILTYHLLNHRIYGVACRDFIRDIQSGKYYGFISPIVVSETIFNFIKANIYKTYGIKPGEVVSMIKLNPGVLAEISLDRPRELLDVFNLLPVGEPEVKEALELVSRFSLLTNDALNAAIMKINKITNIATNDNDFDRAEGLMVWKP